MVVRLRCSDTIIDGNAGRKTLPMWKTSFGASRMKMLPRRSLINRRGRLVACIGKNSLGWLAPLSMLPFSPSWLERVDAVTLLPKMFLRRSSLQCLHDDSTGPDHA